MLDWLLDIDWRTLLLPTLSPLEIFIRGTVIYLGTFTLLRLIVKREFGGLGITDLIVVVFIADAAQNAMAGDYRSLPDGLLLVSVLMLWAYVLDRLAFRFPRVERLVKPRPIPVIRNGELLRPNMRREFITEEELRASLRQQGIEDITRVKEACIESDGRVSFILKH